MNKAVSLITSLFPLWALIASVLALYEPALFTWFQGEWITYGLGFIMLGMGLTLHPEDFKRIARYPLWIFIGLALQYLVMPFLGWSLGYLYNLPAPFAVGLILVSSCPGGTASNVIAYLARANVALSVTMTIISTLMAIILTPTLTAFLAGNRVHVDAMSLFLGAVKVVLLPILLGIILNRYASKYTQRIIPAFPLIAVLIIVLIVASIIGSGRMYIIHSGLVLLTTVVLLHAGGFLFGYGISYLLLKNKEVARTISIEVGMQNSGLGVVLARNSFPDPATAIPSAISSLTHSLIGSLLAAVWRKNNKNDQ